MALNIIYIEYVQTALPILEKLDPYQFWIAYKLFRDATRSINGQPVKVRSRVVDLEAR